MSFKPLLSIALSFLLTVTTFAQAVEYRSDDIVSPDTVLIADPLDEFYSYAQSDTILRVAVVLSDIYGKKDMEFTKGLLLGIHDAQLPDNSISLSIVNGEIPSDSLIYELDLLGPHVVLSTHEKECPEGLLEYCVENGSRLVNVFDVRGNEYQTNANVIQLLSPSNYFNTRVSEYFLDNFRNNIFVIVGEPEASDPILSDLIMNWPENDLLLLMPDELGELTLDSDCNYVFYPTVLANADVKEALSQITRLLGSYPAAGVKVIGRPNWIAFNDLTPMLANLEVFIPAKCYFDSSSIKGKTFIKNYNERYGHAPIRSYPVYAVMGHDVASYMLPKFVEVFRGNLVTAWPPANMLQSFFNFTEPEGVTGSFNKGNYIVHFEPWGTVQKILIGE